MRKAKGLLHVHSRYSYDGEISIPELISLCKLDGYQFVILTEHTENMGQARLNDCLFECDSLSNDAFVVVPGLEIPTDEGYHILALGVRQLLSESSFKGVVRQIHSLGGVAILAHLTKYRTIVFDDLNGIDGVEVWNTKHDSRCFPDVANIRLFTKLASRYPKLKAFGGVDLHRGDQTRRLWLTVTLSELKSEAIIRELLAGNYCATNGLVRLNARVSLRYHQYLFLAISNMLWKLLFLVIGPLMVKIKALR